MTQRIAIVGASSQIATDLIRSFVANGRSDLLLYVRDAAAMTAWLLTNGLAQACSVHLYGAYGEIAHDVVLNFVGVGDPRRAVEMGASIFAVTSEFDDRVLADLERHPQRRYLFLSSGAVYGNAFGEPVRASTQARIPVNDVLPQDWYAAAKLHAEMRHRSRPHLAIVDLRVFNYFSRTQDIEARFFITDIVRAVRDGRALRASADYMVRDFLHPADFHRLVEAVLAAPARNCAVDCYSREAVDKPTLLQAMQARFGLEVETAPASAQIAVNATGAKPHYYSLNRIAAEFGYQPTYTSLDGVIAETEAILEGLGKGSSSLDGRTNDLS
jgi:nucleoside-diphosphate-sugar epimerase